VLEIGKTVEDAIRKSSEFVAVQFQCLKSGEFIENLIGELSELILAEPKVCKVRELVKYSFRKYCKGITTQIQSSEVTQPIEDAKW